MVNNSTPLLYVAIIIIVVLLFYIIIIQGHYLPSSSLVTTTIPGSGASTIPNPTTITPATTTPVQAVDNPTSYHGQAPVVFTQSTTLTGDIVTSGNITILLRGVTINTSGYSLISGGVFDNLGTVDTGLVGNGGSGAGQAGGSAQYSYGGSGGGAWTYGCGNAAGGNSQGNGGSTVVAGGSGVSGFDMAGGSGASGSSPPPPLSDTAIQTMYNGGMTQYLEGAGGGAGTNCGTTANGTSGAYGIYIQASEVIAGSINAVGQSSTGGDEEAGGGGGGGAILVSYGLGGYQSGSYNYNGGDGGTALYGRGGAGGSGGILTYNYSSSPPAPS